MLCEKCSTKLPNDAVACFRCGTITGLTYVVAPPKDPKARTIAATVAITLAAIFVVAAVGIGAVYLAIRNTDSPSITKSDLPPTQTRNEPSAPVNALTATQAPPVTPTPTQAPPTTPKPPPPRQEPPQPQTAPPNATAQCNDNSFSYAIRKGLFE